MGLLSLFSTILKETSSVMDSVRKVTPHVAEDISQSIRNGLNDYLISHAIDIENKYGSHSNFTKIYNKIMAGHRNEKYDESKYKEYQKELLIEKEYGSYSNYLIHKKKQEN